jgi:hypothetical protein
MKIAKEAKDLQEFPRYPKDFKISESQKEGITVRRISSFKRYFMMNLK